VVRTHACSLLVAVHPLRAYDAVQLASTLLTRQAFEGPVSFAVFDMALRAAAVSEGLTIEPASLP